mgnify:CR=1 FL=1
MNGIKARQETMEITLAVFRLLSQLHSGKLKREGRETRRLVCLVFISACDDWSSPSIPFLSVGRAFAKTSADWSKISDHLAAEFCGFCLVGMYSH